MHRWLAALGIASLLSASVPSWAQKSKPPSQSLPTVAAATVPFYPPLARVARVNGTVEVLVTVNNGAVVNTEVKSGHKLLVPATTDNIKTWRFAAGVNATFTTKFIYQLDPASPNPPGNPKIELEGAGPG
jgi:outer membrane biosynthesis protein TonB